jgi:hypothetical protein
MSRIKKFRFLALLAALVLIPTAVFSSCVSFERLDWDDLKNSGSLGDILDFAENYGGSALNAEISARLREMIKLENDPGKLLELIAEYPGSADDLKNRVSELALRAALDEDTYEALNAYIEAFADYAPDRSFINTAEAARNNIRAETEAAARRLREESDWETASALYGARDIIRPLSDFADLYPESEHTPGILEIIARMRDDSAYSEKYLREGAALDLIDEFIADFPGHKDIPTALELRENFIGEIQDFIERGYISASGQGESISRSRIIVENLTESRLIIRVSYGIFLASENLDVQNMLVSEEAEFSVGAGTTRSVYIGTLCMNIHKDIPDETNNFTLALLGEDSPLVELLRLLDENHAGFEVSQAALWHIVDDPGKEKITGTIIHQDGSYAITGEIYEEAVRIAGLLD